MTLLYYLNIIIAIIKIIITLNKLIIMNYNAKERFS